METNEQDSAPDDRKGSGCINVNGEKYPLPQQVLDNIESVIGFEAKQDSEAPFHEKLLHDLAAIFATSQFLYIQIAFFTVWIVLSHSLPGDTLPLGIPKYDLPNEFLDTAALLITTGVLVRQSKQEKLAEQRSHLMLQINLLTEQKVAKIISLLEEMRTELPDLENRYDWEADVMQQATDPQVVLNILQENLNSTLESEAQERESEAQESESEPIDLEPALPHN